MSYSTLRVIERLYNQRGQHTADIAETTPGVLALVAVPRDPKKHLLRWPSPAWAFDRHHLELAKQEGVERTVVPTLRGQVFEATLEDFLEHALAVNYPGHGAQLALPLNRWSVAEEGPKRRVRRAPSAAARRHSDCRECRPTKTLRIQMPFPNWAG